MLTDRVAESIRCAARICLTLKYTSMEFGKFIRECYLRSEPSVDLNDVTKENPIDCCKYNLKVSVYNQLVEEFCENDDQRFACDLWMLQSGPQLVDDTQAVA